MSQNSKDDSSSKLSKSIRLMSRKTLLKILALFFLVSFIWYFTDDNTLDWRNRHSIKEIQTILNTNTTQIGLPLGSISVDGIYGAKTKEAVSKMQEFLNSEDFSSGAVDGLWGPKTLKAYNEAKEAGVVAK